MLVVTPLILAALIAVVCLVLRDFPKIQRRVSLLGATAQFGIALLLFSRVFDKDILVLQAGGWSAPFGVSFVVDTFSAVMVVISAIIAMAVLIYSMAQDVKPLFHPLFHLLLMGVNGSFLTGDLFNLYVWFEVMLMASFVLLILGGSWQELAGGVKYVAINLIGSVMFLSALAFLYAVAGTLNMADLAYVLREGSVSSVTPVVAAFFLIAFALKAGVFPLFFWLPASYHAPSIPVIAVFSGLLTKVGVFVLVRVFALPWGELGFPLKVLIVMLSVLTMVVGVLGAATRMELRRIFSWHIISQIGYMTVGIGFSSVGGVAATIFYLVHHIIVKTNLFFITGIIERLEGTGQLKSLGGLRTKAPWLGALFLIPALSLAGVPPLSGFWAKLLILREAFFLRQWVSAVIIVLVSIFTLFSMVKVWHEVFLKEPIDEEQNDSLFVKSGMSQPPLKRSEYYYLLTPVVFFALWTIAMGIWGGEVYSVALKAAEHVMNPDFYIGAVLNEGVAQ